MFTINAFTHSIVVELVYVDGGRYIVYLFIFFQVEGMNRMSALYLLDSILKNIGSPYTDILKRHVKDVFCRMFKQVSHLRGRTLL